MPPSSALMPRSIAALASLAFGACPEVPSSSDDDADVRELVTRDARDTVDTRADADGEVDGKDGTDGKDGETMPSCTPTACPDDDNPCTDPACGVNGCTHVPNLRLCDDGLACTADDRCSGGRCSGRALDCDDRQQCTDDRCEEGRGCVHDPTEGLCDDDDVCTEGDRCEDGVCIGNPRACPVPIGSYGCATATCDARTGCGVVEHEGACDDGDVCTEGEQCVKGRCVGALVSCGDDDPCTDDYCDPAAGCTRLHNRAPCDDGDLCTVGDRCHEGACVGGAPNGCCDIETGLGCDDEDPCTRERCEAGHCLREPACADDNDCTIDVCRGGVCTFDASPEVPASGQPGLVLADFEGELGVDWRFESDNPEVGWVRDDTWAGSGKWSLYVGKVPDYSYDFGATRAVATWVVALPVDAGELVVLVKSDVGETSCSYDAVTLSVDGVPLLPPVCGGVRGERRWDVARFAGRWVEVELVFDTVDGESNAGSGVWVDAIAVSRVSPAKCCGEGTECP